MFQILFATIMILGANGIATNGIAAERDSVLHAPALVHDQALAALRSEKDFSIIIKDFLGDHWELGKEYKINAHTYTPKIQLQSNGEQMAQAIQSAITKAPAHLLSAHLKGFRRFETFDVPCYQMILFVPGPWLKSHWIHFYSADQVYKDIVAETDREFAYAKESFLAEMKEPAIRDTIALQERRKLLGVGSEFTDEQLVQLNRINIKGIRKLADALTKSPPEFLVSASVWYGWTSRVPKLETVAYLQDNGIGSVKMLKQILEGEMSQPPELTLNLDDGQLQIAVPDTEHLKSLLDRMDRYISSREFPAEYFRVIKPKRR